MAEAKVIFSIQKEKNKVFFETAARWIRTASIPLEGYRTEVPLLLVGYDLEQLSLLGPFFKRMEAKELHPSIYAWDLQKDEPEIVIRFEVNHPDSQLVHEIVGPPYKDAVDAIASWDTLFTAAAANLNRKDMLRFLRMSDAVGAAAIYVIEDIDGDAPTGTRTEVNPLHMFVTQLVRRNRPPPLLS